MITISVPSSTPLRTRKFDRNLPLKTAGLAVWYDAYDPGTLSLDTSGNVSQWFDKSRNSYHLTQSTAGNRPRFVAGDGVELSTTTQSMSNSASINYTTGTTIFIAFKPTDVSGYNAYGGGELWFQFGGFAPGTTSDTAAWGSYRLQKNMLDDLWFGNAKIPGLEYISTNHRVVRYTAGSASTDFRSYGTNAKSGSFATSLYGGSGSTVAFGPIGQGRTIRFREFIAYDNGNLSDAETLRVENYLLAKWGLS